jgi:hypothetical protein
MDEANAQLVADLRDDTDGSPEFKRMKKLKDK